MALKVALGQIDPTVGDLAGNSDLIIQACREAKAAAANLVAFGEMALTGYPIEDLALRRDFQQASVRALAGLAADLLHHGLGELTVVVGYLGKSAGQDSALGTNSAAVIRSGEVVAHYDKHHLPTYGVFDEQRYFVPGDKPCVFHVAGSRVALAICEDIWQDGGTLELLKRQRNEKLDLLVVINGSPFETGKWQTRVDLAARHSMAFGCPLAYINLVGGQDELVFDGGSFVIDATGQLSARAPSFEPSLLMWGTEMKAEPALDARVNRAEAATPSTEAHEIEDVYRALVVATRDYLHKNSTVTALIGLSGGIDSALTAAIACDALGSSNVYGVAMPGPYSSEHSISDAKELAHRAGLHFQILPIDPVVQAFTRSITDEQGQTLIQGIVEENLQARVRGTTLMAISNARGQLVLATGNKSELATGYSTLYGDAVGAFAPLKDVPKTMVWQLAKWRNTDYGRVNITKLMAAWGVDHEIVSQPVPENSITKDPSAELRPDQKDTDSLPDYETLDRILEAYVEGDTHAAGDDYREVSTADSTLAAQVIAMVDRAEFKRRQYPPGPKIGARAFGRDRRLPITMRY